MKRLRVAAVFLWLAWGTIAAEGRQIRLTILHTTDVHGHVLPPLESSYVSAGGSLLRCATLIEQIRREEPQVLLLDSGDALQGSVESWLSQGRIMTRAMEFLRYDAWVLGNHDFDWGVKPLAGVCAELRVPVLGANIRFPAGAENALPTVQPFIVRDIDGIRVAIAGLTTPGIPFWLREDVIGPLQVDRSKETLLRLLPRLREVQPDVMILLVHQGYLKGGDDEANEVAQIVRQFPEFDVVLGGHLHWVVPGMTLDGVLYAQAGHAAQGVGRVDLVYDTVQRRVVEKRGEFLAVSPQTPEHDPLRQTLAGEIARTTLYLAETVGVSAVHLEASPKFPGQSPVQQLICAAIADATGAEVVLHGLLSQEDLAPGPILQSDIWRIVPYENRLGTAWLTAAELREILEEASAYAGSTHYLGAYGLAFDYVPSAAPGERIARLRYADGRYIHPRQRLKAAFNSHTLASAGGRYAVLRAVVERPTSRLEMTEVDTRSAVVKYVRAHSPLTIEAGASVKTIRARP